MVAYLHSEYPNAGTYELISTWPDSIRSQRIYAYSHWHYIAVSFSSDDTPLKNKVDTDNAVWALNSMKAVIKNDHANMYERARFLAFFSHIVGDLHQPLHTVTRFSLKKRNGDLGGNTFNIYYHNKRISLHKLWDEGVGEFDASPTADNVAMITKDILAVYPKKYFGKKIDDLSFNNWTTEGMSNARQYVYKVDEEQSPGEDYLSQGKNISAQQAALAGYRLANLLNQLIN
jgi:hypothetical protein